MYSFDNINVYLNGSEIKVQNAQIGLSNSLVPNYVVGQTMNNHFNYTDGIQGNLSLSYVITGTDFLLDYIIREESAKISGYVGGLYFNSGLLSDYSVSCKANSSIRIDGVIKFFEPIKGSIIPNYSNNSSINIEEALHANSITLEDMAGTTETIDEIKDFSLKYQADVLADYKQKSNYTGEISPDRIFFGQRQVTSSILTNSEHMNFSSSGNFIGMRINAYRPVDSSLEEIFLISGLLASKSLSVGSDGVLENSYDIITHAEVLDLMRLASRFSPSIDSFIPTSGKHGTSVTVYGNNLNTVTMTKVGNGGDWVTPMQKNEEFYRFTVPFNSFTGPISAEVWSPSQSVISSSQNFTILPFGITIDDSSIRIIDRGEQVAVYGSDFLGITSVKLGSYDTQFSVIDEHNLTFTAPNYSTSFTGAPLYVISDTYSATGVSSRNFAPYAKIEDIVPKTGIPGSVIEIKGSNFWCSPNVKFFNYVNNKYNTGSVLSMTSSGINVVMPASGTEGPLKIDFSYGGLSHLDIQTPSLRPIAFVSGGLYNASMQFNPTFLENEVFSGLAYNLDYYILNSSLKSNNKVNFLMRMGNQLITAERVNTFGNENWTQPMWFSGYTANVTLGQSESDFDGKVRILDYNGNEFPNPHDVSIDISFNTVIDDILIENPLYFYTYLEDVGADILTLKGKNLDLIDRIYLTGQWQSHKAGYENYDYPASALNAEVNMFGYVIPTGRISLPMDIAGSRLDIVMTGLAITGGVLSRHSMSGGMDSDNNPWYIYGLFTDMDSESGTFWSEDYSTQNTPNGPLTWREVFPFHKKMALNQIWTPDMTHTVDYGFDTYYLGVRNGVTLNHTLIPIELRHINNKIRTQLGYVFTGALDHQTRMFNYGEYVYDFNIWNSNEILTIAATLTAEANQDVYHINTYRPHAKENCLAENLSNWNKIFGKNYVVNIGGQPKQILTLDKVSTTPYVTLSGYSAGVASGFWEFKFYEPQKISNVYILAQDTYHKAEVLEGHNGLYTFSEGTDTAFVCDIELRPNRGTFTGLKLIPNGTRALQGVTGINLHISDNSWMGDYNQFLVNYYYGGFMTGMITGVESIYIRNNPSNGTNKFVMTCVYAC
jgi:hypothetical protein